MAAAFELGPINALRVCVSDPERARAFYRDLIGLKETYAGEVVTFALGGASLVVETAEPDDAEGQALIGRYMSVTFASADVQRDYEALRGRGVRFLEPPERQPWGAIFAHFCDPDENVFTLVQLPTRR